MTVFIGSTPQSGALHTHCFSVVAEPDPSVMPRVMDVFASRSYVPDQCHSIISRDHFDHDRTELHIDLQLSAINQRQADHLARELRQLVCVSSVLTSEKRELQTGTASVYTS